MTLAQLQAKAEEIIRSFPGRWPVTPRIELCTPAELGRSIDGRFTVSLNLVQLRRRPSSCDIEFLLAHELAHAWQHANNVPFSEDQADRMAANAVRYSHFDLAQNRLRPGEML